MPSFSFKKKGDTLSAEEWNALGAQIRRRASSESTEGMQICIFELAEDKVASGRYIQGYRIKSYNSTYDTDLILNSSGKPDSGQLISLYDPSAENGFGLIGRSWVDESHHGSRGTAFYNFERGVWEIIEMQPPALIIKGTSIDTYNINNVVVLQPESAFYIPGELGKKNIPELKTTDRMGVELMPTHYVNGQRISAGYTYLFLLDNRTQQYKAVWSTTYQGDSWISVTDNKDYPGGGIIQHGYTGATILPDQTRSFRCRGIPGGSNSIAESLFGVRVDARGHVMNLVDDGGQVISPGTDTGTGTTKKDPKPDPGFTTDTTHEYTIPSDNPGSSDTPPTPDTPSPDLPAIPPMEPGIPAIPSTPPIVPTQPTPTTPQYPVIPLPFNPPTYPRPQPTLPPPWEAPLSPDNPPAGGGGGGGPVIPPGGGGTPPGRPTPIPNQPSQPSPPIPLPSNPGTGPRPSPGGPGPQNPSSPRNPQQPPIPLPPGGAPKSPKNPPPAKPKPAPKPRPTPAPVTPAPTPGPYDIPSGSLMECTQDVTKVNGVPLCIKLPWNCNVKLFLQDYSLGGEGDLVSDLTKAVASLNTTYALEPDWYFHYGECCHKYMGAQNGSFNPYVSLIRACIYHQIDDWTGIYDYLTLHVQIRQESVDDTTWYYKEQLLIYQSPFPIAVAGDCCYAIQNSPVVLQEVSGSDLIIPTAGIGVNTATITYEP